MRIQFFVFSEFGKEIRLELIDYIMVYELGIIHAVKIGYVSLHIRMKRCLC